MALRLRIVSDHASRLGEQATKVFGVHGGTIGRGSDNEWILPDPERYLSGKHMRVDFRAGTYVLVDTSSNGTYVNGAQIPLGKYHDYLLKDGDYVRLGEYELLVSIDKSNDFPPEEGAIVAYDGQSPSSSVKKSTADDLGDDLDLSQLLEPSDLLASDLLAGDSGVRPRDAYGQAVVGSGAGTGSGSAGGGGAGGGGGGGENRSYESDEDASGTPWHMMTRPFKVAGKGAEESDAQNAPNLPGTPTGMPNLAGMPNLPGGPGSSGAFNPGGAPTGGRAQNPMLYEGDFDIGLAAFCRGAGIDPRTFSSEARAAAMQLAGQLLRESVLGLMDMNQGRNEFLNRFRIAPPVNDGPESPLNFSRGVDEALVRLLTTSSTRAGSVEAIRRNFRELKAQNTASLTATRSAFEEFLGRVDPKELEERFERATKRGVFGSQNKSKYWELYGEMFAGLAQRPADGFPHLFTEAFAKAYEAKWRALIPPQRGSFGAERAEPADPSDHAVGDT